MNTSVTELVVEKLAQKLQAVDTKTADEIRAVWAGISAGPDCPYVLDVMQKIIRVCHQGLSERSDAARAVIEGTLAPPLLNALTERTRKDIAAAATRMFPPDQFVTLAEQTRGVYARHGSMSSFDEEVFALQLTLIKVQAANLSRAGIQNVQRTLNELRQKRSAQRKASVRKHALITIGAVIAAAAGYFLGFK